MITFFLFLFIQIVSESLPISSSGHVRILQHFFPAACSVESMHLLDFVAHGPTIIIIILIFFKDWWFPISRLLFLSTSRSSRKRLMAIFLKIVAFVLAIDLITAIFYWLIRVVLCNAFWLNNNYTLLIGFVVTMVCLSRRSMAKTGLLWGVVLLDTFCFAKHSKIRFVSSSVLRVYKYENKVSRSTKCSRLFECDTKWRVSRSTIQIILGLVQGLALLPGISRFATTYVAARWFRYSSRRAFQLSFLIEFPLLCAAFIKGTFGIAKMPIASLFNLPVTWIVLVLAILFGFFALKIAQMLALNNRFWWFGVYMIMPISVQFYIVVSNLGKYVC